VTYRIEIKPSAKKELERLEDSVLRRVDSAIHKLSDNPRSPGSIKLTGVPISVVFSMILNVRMFRIGIG